MQIYRLLPTAPADDPSWQHSPFQGELVVRAKSSGDARQVATEAELDFPQTEAKPAEGVSTNMASAFRNEKLYTVVEDLSGEFPADGARAILRGAVDPNVVLPGRSKG